MISKSSLLLILSLLCLSVWGDEALVMQSLEKSKQFRQVSEVVRKDTMDFYSFQFESVYYRVVCATTSTKSGTITFVAVLDPSGMIVHFDIPAYQNKQNASLTSKFFLKQFHKKRPSEKPIVLGSGVDAISGASLSTGSLIEAVNREVARLENRELSRW